MKFLKVFVGGILGLALLFVAGVWLTFKIGFEPKPNISTYALKDGAYCVGQACRKQTKTLDAFVQQAAAQLALVHSQRLDLWPVDAFAGKALYFVDHQKSKAWKVDMAAGTAKPAAPGTIPELDSVLNHPVSFHQLFKKEAGEDGMIVVLHERELLDEKRNEKYPHLGTYDPLITFLHEGFHMWGQDERVFANPAKIGNRSRDDAFELINARAMRVNIYRLVNEAISNPAEREAKAKAAIATWQAYKMAHPKEAADGLYFDRIEGMAHYFENTSLLRSSYPEIKTVKDHVAAYGLIVRNTDPRTKAGVVNEAYAIGASVGILLDALSTDPMAWKKELMADGNLAPMDLLARQFPKDASVKPVLPTKKDETELAAYIKQKGLGGVNKEGFAALFYDMIFS